MTHEFSLMHMASCPELNQLLDCFVEQLRAGKASTVEEFAAEHPQYAIELRELLPALVFAEQLNPKGSTSGGKAERKVHQLGAFRLHRELGCGGMGIVFEATHAQTGQAFAVKMLQPRLARSPTLRARFLREADAASRLHHPHIVPAKYFGSEGDHDYLVMKLIDGVSLDRLIYRKETCEEHFNQLFGEIVNDWSRIAEIGANICSALAHAHDQGMIHRDVKPANLMLDRSGRIWITDFGLAKIEDEDGSQISRTGEVLGTPRYMRPEQIFGISDVRSDIYGLGLTLYEIIIFGQGKSEEWMKLQKDSNYVTSVPVLQTLCPAVPAKLSEFIMRACAHHPGTRYQSARDFEFALNRFRFRGRTDRRSAKRADKAQRRWLWITTLAAAGGIAFLGTRYNSPTDIDIKALTAAIQQATAPKSSTDPRPENNYISFKDPDSDAINFWISVNKREDDAEEYPEDGQLVMYLDSADLEMTWDEVRQVVGLRFPHVEVPRGALIETAELSFCSAQTEEIETKLQIYAIDETNVASFTPIDGDLSKRKLTQQNVEWVVSPWERGYEYDSPSCKALVQYLVDRPDWSSGQAMGFIIKGTGKRVAMSYDGNIHNSPKLKIKYLLPSTPEPMEEVRSGP